MRPSLTRLVSLTVVLTPLYSRSDGLHGRRQRASFLELELSSLSPRRLSRLTRLRLQNYGGLITCRVLLGLFEG